MTILTAHTEAQGVTYLEHLAFAVRIAWRLLRTATVFTAHGLLPFVGIRRELDLEATAAFINAQNEWIEAQKFVARDALAA